MKELLFEIKKKKTNKLLLLFILLMIANILWLGNYKDQDLLYNAPLCHAILLPLTLTTLCSTLWDMEYKNSMLKLLFTLQSPVKIYRAKNCIALLFIGLFTVLEVLYLFFRFSTHGDIDTETYIYFGLSTMIISLLLFNMVQLILVISNKQLLVFLFGLCGTLLGLFSLFFPSPLRLFIPWSYYGLFPLVNMSWDSATRIATFSPSRFHYDSLLLCGLLAVIFYVLGRYFIERKEV